MESSLPANFDAELGQFTREGLRVIALASRPLTGVSESEVQAMGQDSLEQGLSFLGFAVMVNPLRPDTAEVLAKLQEAGIRCVMCTGDHARTAVSMAQQCGMLCQNKPVLVVDTASSEGSVDAVALVAQVTTPDGSTGPPGEVAPLLAEVAAGDLEAAVSGRGFEKVGRKRGPHH